jgi:hypothetical protein
MKTFNKIFLTFTFLLFFFFSYQGVEAYACPNYTFGQNLAKGANSPDVKVIQEILNLDKRTVVAYSGPGSKGSETTVFGTATRESLKRFQALFIEFIGVADGKFNSKTRTVMNSVCKGPFFTGGGGSVYDLDPKDSLPPIIGVAAVSQTSVDIPFRAYIASSEAIKTPTLTGLIISGAIASDLRKTSSTTFSFLVTPNIDVAGVITIQIEADSIEDLAGNTNPVASNEWVVSVIRIIDPTATITLPEIDFPTIATSTDCSTVASVSVYDYTNPCYGRVPTVDPNAGGQTEQPGQSSMDLIMNLLTGLLKGFTGLGGTGGTGGAGVDAGGIGTTPGFCACAAGQTTIGLVGIKGPSGRFINTANPGLGNYTGKVLLTPPAICGQLIVKGKCVNEKADNTGQIVIGVLPPPTTFMWGQ